MPQQRKGQARGNFQRAHFDEAEARCWRCIVCGAKPESALHRREGGSFEPMPYNLRQQLCSPACVRQRKTELQRERRLEKRREGTA